MLAARLMSNIMPLAIMDKKYKDTVPQIVARLPTGGFSREDVASVVLEYQKKTPKGNKVKMGKTGLYPGEEASIVKWWLDQQNPNPNLIDEGSKSNSTGASLLELRARETQLQIILVLETLALRASNPKPQEENIVLDEAKETEHEPQPNKKRQKKPQDLNVLLEMFVDRLCIWQSMRLEDSSEMRLEDREREDQEKSGRRAPDSDILSNFCADVILPFYGARIPETTNMLRKRLGGAKTPSPVRPTLAKAVSSSHQHHKSGTAMKRPGALRHRRTLERVLTDEKTASQRRAPALSRSITDSALPGLKCEASDTSLSSIPLNRLALHKSRRYSQREIDLNAVSQAAEAKLQRKASTEQELQKAIATLKKPNPRMAVKELVDEADKRAAGSHNRSKHVFHVFHIDTHLLQNQKIPPGISSPEECKSRPRRKPIDKRMSSLVIRKFNSAHPDQGPSLRRYPRRVFLKCHHQFKDPQFCGARVTTAAARLVPYD